MNMPRIMFTAASSGSGKTLVTCGVLQALVNRGMDVVSFKSGPDYIDHMFHESIIGTRSGNIDTFFMDTEMMRYLFGRIAEDADVTVIEGVMGFYDGAGLTTTKASSWDISCKLGTPVIFVASCGLLGGSLGAVIKGYTEFRKNNIKGIILNKADEETYPEVKAFVEKETGVKVLGYLPNVEELVIESRHLGLVSPKEVYKLKEKLNLLANMIERTIDVEELIRIAESADTLEYDEPNFDYKPIKVRIGVAKDDCFCFIYKDNIELLERLGAEIVFFSPLEDKCLPNDVGGIILFGGYTELYAERLSKNIQMLSDIRKKIAEGMPCLAESGGFLYLHNEIEDNNGKFHKMVGTIDAKAFRADRLSHFGYVEVSPYSEGLFGKDMKIKGHEFHCWDSTNCGKDCVAEKASGERYDCMFAKGNLFAGFPAFYYYSCPELVYRFLKGC